MRTIVALLALVLSTAVSAYAITATRGTVDANDESHVTVSGQRYPIGPDTELLDGGGHRVAVKELVPGTPVELEIGDDGDLTVLRAKLIR